MTKRFLLALALCTATTACSLDSTSSFSCNVPTLVTDQRGDTVETVTGLEYINLSAGSGDTVAACQPVSIDYVLRLEGDTTETIIQQQDSFTVVPGSGYAIAGVEQGVVGMKEGGERLLIIPPSLGFGSQDNGAVPGGSTLLFNVTIRDVSPPAE